MLFQKIVPKQKLGDHSGQVYFFHLLYSVALQMVLKGFEITKNTPLSKRTSKSEIFSQRPILKKEPHGNIFRVRPQNIFGSNEK